MRHFHTLKRERIVSKKKHYKFQFFACVPSKNMLLYKCSKEQPNLYLYHERKRKMKKDDFLKAVSNYEDFARTVNAHSKDAHNGAWGTLLELEIKKSLNNTRQLKSGAGKVDTRKKGFKIEIKSACGELATLDENGEMVTSIFKNDFIIYAPFYEPDDDIFTCCYVLTIDGFKKALESANMIRQKMSTNMSKRKKAGLPYYNDRLAIQSFTNSKKKTAAWLTALDENGISLEEWFEIMGL